MIFTQNLDFMEDYEKVRPLLGVRLIGAKRNRPLLSEVVYIPMEDMAIVFYCMLESDESKSRMVMIPRSLPERWNISLEKLYNDAVINCARMLPLQFTRIEELLEIPYSPEGFSLYVITNEKYCLGASAILYPDALRRIGNRLNSDFVLIPSSIHEMLALPSSREDLQDGTVPGPDDLHEMIREINGTFDKQEDVLTDSVYFYQRDDEKFLRLNF